MCDSNWSRGQCAPPCCLVKPTQIGFSVQVERVIFLKQDAAGGPLKYLCKVTPCHLRALHRCTERPLNSPPAQVYVFQSAQVGALLQACCPSFRVSSGARPCCHAPECADWLNVLLCCSGRACPMEYSAFQSTQVGDLLQAWCSSFRVSSGARPCCHAPEWELTVWSCCCAAVEGLALWGVHLGDLGGCAESWRLPGSSGLCGGLALLCGRCTPTALAKEPAGGLVGSEV